MRFVNVIFSEDIHGVAAWVRELGGLGLLGVATLELLREGRVLGWRGDCPVRQGAVERGAWPADVLDAAVGGAGRLGGSLHFAPFLGLDAGELGVDRLDLGFCGGELCARRLRIVLGLGDLRFLLKRSLSGAINL